MSHNPINPAHLETALATIEMDRVAASKYSNAMEVAVAKFQQEQRQSEREEHYRQLADLLQRPIIQTTIPLPKAIWMGMDTASPSAPSAPPLTAHEMGRMNDTGVGLRPLPAPAAPPRQLAAFPAAALRRGDGMGGQPLRLW